MHLKLASNSKLARLLSSPGQSFPRVGQMKTKGGAEARPRAQAGAETGPTPAARAPLEPEWKLENPSFWPNRRSTAGGRSRSSGRRVWRERRSRSSSQRMAILTHFNFSQGGKWRSLGKSHYCSTKSNVLTQCINLHLWFIEEI